jgi:dTDP-4-dehydrorhamnose reductase
MLKILLFGKYGQLGWELERSLQPLGSVLAYDFPQIDFLNELSFHELIPDISPDIVINATAYTDVDGAESDQDNADQLNNKAPALLAEQANKQGAVLIHYSTDYVFDGAKGSAYIESDTPSPLSVYGRTKLAGERAIQDVGGRFYIFRTSWLYSLRRPSFVGKVLSWARKSKTLRIVSDQISSPTWSRMLAEITTLWLVGQIQSGSIKSEDLSGLYHLSAAGAVSRFEWAKAILALDPNPEEQIAEQVLPASSLDFDTAAVRPGFSALDCSLFQEKFELSLPDWYSSLKLAMVQDSSH